MKKSAGNRGNTGTFFLFHLLSGNANKPMASLTTCYWLISNIEPKNYFFFTTGSHTWDLYAGDCVSPSVYTSMSGLSAYS